MNTGLGGARVLITRPAHQAETLCHLIAAAGGEPVGLPAIEIAPPADPAALTQVLERLEHFDLAVFVSPNAVRATLAHLNGPLPAALTLAAVGDGTRRALAAAGYAQVLAPPERFDSEGLLALPALQNMRGRRVLILRGDSGRELLADGLRSRGAEVTYAECYRRRVPVAPDRTVLARIAGGEVDVAVITSSEALANLLALAGDGARDSLLATPLVVVSARQAQAARALGFRAAIEIAARADDTAILAAVRAWRAARNSL